MSQKPKLLFPESSYAASFEICTNTVPSWGRKREEFEICKAENNFPKNLSRISVATLHTRKNTEVCERLEVNTWQCVMLSCDLPLKASHKGACNASTAENDGVSFGSCRRTTWKQPAPDSFATAAHLHPLWISKPWVENLFVWPGPFPLSLCAFQIAQENRWCTPGIAPHNFVPNKPEPQNFLQIVTELALTAYCPVSLTGYINIILQILSLV